MKRLLALIVPVLLTGCPAESGAKMTQLSLLAPILFFGVLIAVRLIGFRNEDTCPECGERNALKNVEMDSPDGKHRYMYECAHCGYSMERTPHSS